MQDVLNAILNFFKEETLEAVVSVVFLLLLPFFKRIFNSFYLAFKASDENGWPFPMRKKKKNKGFPEAIDK